MKTKIEELVSRKLYLTDLSGIVGEIFIESDGLIKIKVGDETSDFIVNNPVIELIDPIVSHSLTLDISHNQNYRVRLTTALSGSDVLNINLNTQPGILSRGEIVVKIETATFGYLYYNIAGARYLNSSQGYPTGYERDIISYFFDGQELFVNLGNSYQPYVFSKQ